MSKNMIQLERRHTIRRIPVAYWISKPTRAQAQAHTHLHAHTNIHIECTHANECSHSCARALARTHTHTHTHTHAHTKCVILIAFNGKSGCVNALRSDVTRTLLLLLLQVVFSSGLRTRRCECQSRTLKQMQGFRNTTHWYPSA